MPTGRNSPPNLFWGCWYGWVTAFFRNIEGDSGEPHCELTRSRTDLNKHHARVIAQDHVIGEGADIVQDRDCGSTGTGDVLNQAVQSVFFILLVQGLGDAVAIEDQTRA